MGARPFVLPTPGFLVVKHFFEPKICSERFWFSV